MASLQPSIRGRGVTEACAWSYDTALILEWANTPDNGGLDTHTGHTTTQPHTPIIQRANKLKACTSSHAYAEAK